MPFAQTPPQVRNTALREYTSLNDDQKSAWRKVREAVKVFDRDHKKNEVKAVFEKETKALEDKNMTMFATPNLKFAVLGETA